MLGSLIWVLNEFLGGVIKRYHTTLLDMVKLVHCADNHSIVLNDSVCFGWSSAFDEVDLSGLGHTHVSGSRTSMGC